MALSHRDRPNPARNMEIAAVRLITGWVGARGNVRDCGDGHEPDIRIEYHDTRLGLGEVGWDETPDAQALQAELVKSEDPGLPLQPGSGQWFVSVHPSCNLRILRRQLDALVSSLVALGCRELDPVLGRSPLAKRAVALGIDHMRQVTVLPRDEACILQVSEAGVVPDTPEVIVDWIDELAERVPDLMGKLLSRLADERHAFVWVGSGTPFGARMHMLRPLTKLPTRSPKLPDGITHVWALAPSGIGNLIMWSFDEGWTSWQLDVDADGVTPAFPTLKP